MLEAIVKDIRLALFLLASLVPYPHPAAFDAHQRKVEPELLICGSVVRSDVGLGNECTEEGVVVKVWDMFLYKGHCDWHFFAVIVELHIVQLQVENIPLSAIDRFIPHAVLRLAVRNPRWPPIWLESFLVS